MKQHKQQFVKKKYLTPLFFCSKILKVEKVWQVIPMKMDKIYEQTMLFDFYGELLTEHQRTVYADALYNDMSLGEIAEEQGISRQGVHDLIKRCDRLLQDYESKLHLVERFAREKAAVREILELSVADNAPEGELVSRLRRIGELSQKLLGEL